jgi:hypothetical protein
MRSWLSSVPSPNRKHPVGAVAQVVVDLFDGLGSNARNTLVLGVHQFGEQQLIEHIEHELSRNGIAKMAVGKLANEGVGIVALQTQIGKVVLTPTLSFRFASVGKQTARMTQKV